MSDIQDDVGPWPPLGVAESEVVGTVSVRESGRAQAGDEDGLFPAPVSVAPRTGDTAVDQALAHLEQGARDDDLDAQVAAGERAHHELQGRLDDLGTA
ncbi:MAG: hypothetical protein M3Y71_04630 [Actinomycetota bacterium]|nr:hypothetical protein [Actinomycetota bacterium]